MAEAAGKSPPQTVRDNIRSQHRRELESWLLRNGHPPLPRRANSPLALCAAGRFLGRNEQLARIAAGGFGEEFRRRSARFGAAASLCRRHSKVSVAFIRRRLYRKRSNSRKPESDGRCRRPKNPLRLHPSRLRLRLPLLRQRTGRLKTPSRSPRNCRPSACGGKSSAQENQNRHRQQKISASPQRRIVRADD